MPLRRDAGAIIGNLNLERAGAWICRYRNRTGAEIVVGNSVGDQIAQNKIERRGKYLILRLDDGLDCIVHLKMTGGFRIGSLLEPPRFERLRASTTSV